MISIDYQNKLVLSTSSITDIIAFHLQLRDFEDNVDGMLYPVIHTYKEISLGGSAVFPAIEFINGWQLKFPNAGNYTISGGNLKVNIVPVAGVFISLTQSAAYAVTSAGSSSVTPEQVATAVWDHSIAQALNSKIDFIKNIEGGRWKIASNQMIFYKEDNITELARFDLKDASGSATSNNPMERVRI